jgi:hypothetical protein
MAVYFLTSQPAALLAAFKKKIDDANVVTWSYDQQGDFTHTAEQWKYLAWLRPIIKSDRLTMCILKNKNKPLTPATYGIYHGRIIESMLTHCDKLFTDGVATAMPTSEDTVS